jgi:hypothetical protein
MDTGVECCIALIHAAFLPIALLIGVNDRCTLIAFKDAEACLTSVIPDIGNHPYRDHKPLPLLTAATPNPHTAPKISTVRAKKRQD